MQTDWNLIREVLAAAVDACEAAEGLGLTETDRSRDAGGDGVTVFDVWTSAWTYPETLEMQVVRSRHDLEDDLPYVPENARVLRHVGGLCGSLIGAGHLDDSARGTTTSIRATVRGLCDWYRNVMTPRLRAATDAGPGSDGPLSSRGR